MHHTIYSGFAKVPNHLAIDITLRVVSASKVTPAEIYAAILDQLPTLDTSEVSGSGGVWVIFNNKDSLYLGKWGWERTRHAALEFSDADILTRTLPINGEWCRSLSEAACA